MPDLSITLHKTSFGNIAKATKILSDHIGMCGAVRTLDDIPYIDKIVHLSMYLGTCSVFWFEYKCNGYKWHKCRLALIGVVAPILMSGVIELAQAYLTTYRTGDWADFATNSMGVLLALIVKYFIDQANGKICRG